jgi:hypothetical protein
MVYQVDEPLMSLFCIWLCFSTPVRKFWSINAGKSYVQLGFVSIQDSACPRTKVWLTIGTYCLISQAIPLRWNFFPW